MAGDEGGGGMKGRCWGGGRWWRVEAARCGRPGGPSAAAAAASRGGQTMGWTDGAHQPARTRADRRRGATGMPRARFRAFFTFQPRYVRRRTRHRASVRVGFRAADSSVSSHVPGRPSRCCWNPGARTLVGLVLVLVLVFHARPAAADLVLCAHAAADTRPRAPGELPLSTDRDQPDRPSARPQRWPAQCSIITVIATSQTISPVIRLQ